MKIAGIQSRPLGITCLLLLFLLIDFPYQYGVRYLSFTDSASNALFDMILYTGILFIITRVDLLHLTLCFLALPYLAFIPGWLNSPTAIILMSIFIMCLLRTAQANSLQRTASGYKHITEHIMIGDFLAFVLILVWVNLSGIGGYGFQWQDYGINNGRLHDLIVNQWPIRYGENQNFVYYFGYFLPPAIIGKLFSVNVATHSAYLWAVVGITLAARWLAYLTHWRFSFVLVLAFILFGPLDILNVFYIQRHDSTPLVELADIFRYNDMDALNFTTSYQMRNYLPDFGAPFFLGNYPSNTFQLFWSPQQLIAGWLCASMMMHLFMQEKTQHILFVYALLSLWGPLVMIALMPVVAIALAIPLFTTSPARVYARKLFSIENILGAGSLACVFIIFYLGGSTSANPSIWLVNAINWHKHLDLMIVFYLAAWGIYTIALMPFILKSDTNTRIWFAGLLIALLILPLRIFGEWSDLLCRGSAPLMFLLLIFLLKAIQHYWHTHQKLQAAALLCLLITGSTSALLTIRASNENYGQTQPVTSLLSYKNTYTNFGPDDSLFNHLFRHALPDKQPELQDHE